MHRSVGRLAALVACAALGLAAVVAPVASASPGGDYYCGNEWVCPARPGNQTWTGQATVPLTYNEVTGQVSSWQVCAGAADSSFNFYGSYICHDGDTSHPYGGGNWLYPYAHNSSGSQNLTGWENWA